MKEAVNYTTLEFPELLSRAMSGDREAAAEIIRRQDAQKQEIELLKVKANSKARAPRPEKTPADMAKDSAYFRTALLVKEFGQESVNMQTLTVASAFLDQGLAQGNLRQAFNRVSQVLKAQKVEEQVFPEWIVQAAGEIPIIDENLKLEEEQEKVEEIKAIIQKYLDEQLPPPPAEIVIPDTPAPAAPAPAAPAPAAPAPAAPAPAATTQAKKASKK